MDSVRINLIMLAHEILNMQAQLDQQEMELAELREYKEKYFELLDSSIKHGQDMAGQVLTLLLNKGEFPEGTNTESEKDS